MSLPQKPYVDYKQAGFGDLGTNDSSSVQPILDGQPLNGSNLSRGGENLRGRSEIARGVLEDLLYYRDHTRYVLSTSGTLSWAGTVALGGTGISTNSSTLTITPITAPRANLKGFLRIGTAAVNALTYTVQPTAYSTDGVNAVFVEHRSVPGTVTPSCVITAGPVYRVVIIFDSANSAHDAPTIAPLVQAQLAGVTALNGKIVCASNGAASTAIAAQAEIAISARTHPGGTAGNATLDVEQHTLAAGALGTFTAANPLAEGDVVAIRYDYLVEPVGGDASDPKAGAAGGRAESILGRGNTDVSANLFILDAFPQYAPGAIPLCKVVNNVLRWLDGTAVSAGTAVAPGTGLGTTISAAGFSGAPTLVVGGGLLTTDTTLNAALTSTNTRLGQLRRETWTVTDGTNSTGGHYSGAAAAATAAASVASVGGEIYVRAGAYSAFVNTGITTIGGVLIGESQSRVAFLHGAAATVAGSSWELHNAAVDRSGDFLTQIGLRRASNLTVSAATLRVTGSPCVSSDWQSCAVTTSATASTQTYGLSFDCARVTARDCSFSGPAAGTVGGSVVQLEDDVQTAQFTNCSFAAVGTAVGVSIASSGTVFSAPRVFTFTNCRFTNNAAAAVLTMSGNNSTTPLTVVFDKCTFANANNGQLIAAAPGAGIAVRFIDCTFQQNNTSTGDVTRVRANPSTGASVEFVRCTLRVGQTASTGAPTNPIVELGGTAGTGSAGRTTADGFLVIYENTASGLKAGDNIRLFQSTTATTDNSFTGIDIDCGGFSIGATAGYILRCTGTDVLPSLRVGTLQVRNSPAAGQGGCISLEYTTVQSLHVQLNASVAAYTGTGINLASARILGGAIPFMRGSNFINAIGTPASRAGLSNVLVRDIPSTSVTTYSILLSQAFLEQCDLRVNSTSAPSIIELTLNSTVSDCVLRYQHAGAEVVRLNAGSAIGCSVVNNQIIFDNATGTTAISNTNHPSFICGTVIGNRVANVNATVPSLAAPPATSVVANNAFIGSYAF